MSSVAVGHDAQLLSLGRVSPAAAKPAAEAPGVTVAAPPHPDAFFPLAARSMGDYSVRMFNTALPKRFASLRVAGTPAALQGRRVAEPPPLPAA